MLRDMKLLYHCLQSTVPSWLPYFKKGVGYLEMVPSRITRTKKVDRFKKLLYVCICVQKCKVKTGHYNDYVHDNYQLFIFLLVGGTEKNGYWSDSASYLDDSR